MGGFVWHWIFGNKVFAYSTDRQTDLINFNQVVDKVAIVIGLKKIKVQLNCLKGGRKIYLTNICRTG